MSSEASKEERLAEPVSECHEEICWGCGLCILLPSYSPIFKCGWCGAVTNKNQVARRRDSRCFARWRHVRDQFLVTILLLFMFFVISVGVWAVYPVVFSIRNSFGVFHCMLIAVLSITTISSFSLASFRSAGEPENILWGSYPLVQKDGLDDYTFCSYCRKPKPPRAHHCRSCRICVVDMDHHCPFIGNCVGEGNHRFFVGFLMSVVVSCAYVCIMSLYAGYHIWPPLEYEDLHASGLWLGSSREPLVAAKLFISALASSAILLSLRGLVLLYLAFASVSVEVGISVLLCQQLNLIYQGDTYIGSLNSDDGKAAQRGCHNVLGFFGCPTPVYRLLLGHSSAVKMQHRSSSKLL